MLASPVPITTTSHPITPALLLVLVLSISYLLHSTHSLDNVSLLVLKATISMVPPVPSVLLIVSSVPVLPYVHSMSPTHTTKVYGPSI